MVAGPGSLNRVVRGMRPRISFYHVLLVSPSIPGHAPDSQIESPAVLTVPGLGRQGGSFRFGSLGPKLWSIAPP